PAAAASTPSRIASTAPVPCRSAAHPSSGAAIPPTLTDSPSVTPLATPTRPGRYSWPSTTSTLPGTENATASGTRSTAAHPADDDQAQEQERPPVVGPAPVRAGRVRGRPRGREPPQQEGRDHDGGRCGGHKPRPAGEGEQPGGQRRGEREPEPAADPEHTHP